MAPPLIVRVVGDASSLYKTLDSSTAAVTGFTASIEKSAAAQVAGNEKAIASQRALLAELLKVQAASSAVGGDRQVAANLAVADAQAKLNRSLGLTTVATGRAGASAKEAERDFGKLTRGALAGSGVFSALGRSLAFASGGFLAVAGGAAIISKSITAALDLAATQRQVDQQLKVSGKSWEKYGEQIDAANLKLSHIAGFTDVELLQSFTTLVRATGNVAQSLHLNAVAADVARGRHIGLAAASNALAKAAEGSFAALRRLNIIVPQGSSVMEALAFVQQKYAGQAQAGTTAADRFRAALIHTEDIVGTALLPTFDRLVTRLGNWLAKANETGRIQRDVNEAVKIGAVAFHTLGAVVSDGVNVFHTLEPILNTTTAILQKLGSLLGGTNVTSRLLVNTFEVLIGLRIASTIAGWVTSLKGLSLSWDAVAGSAATAGKAEADALAVGGGAGVGKGLAAGAASRGSLLRGAVPVIIVASLIPGSKSGQDTLDASGAGAFGRLPLLGPLFQQEGRLLRLLGSPPKPLTPDNTFRLGGLSLQPGTGEALRALNLAGANLPPTASAKQEEDAAKRLNAAAKRSAKVAQQVRNAIIQINDARSQLLAAISPNDQSFIPSQALLRQSPPRLLSGVLTGPVKNYPTFTTEGPRFYAAAFAHNAPFARPSSNNYQTRLTPKQEQLFQTWVAQNNVPFDPNAKNVDYDMRGYWLAMHAGQVARWAGGQTHFPDTFKTPFDTTFSRESRYATANNPFVWRGNRLIDRRDGSLVFGTPTIGQRLTDYLFSPLRAITSDKKGSGFLAGVSPIAQWASYKLTTAEGVAQAQAALTKATTDDVAAAKQIIARIKRVIDAGHLHGKALIEALQQEASALGIVQSAADSARAKRQTARSTYNIPVALQVTQASLETYGKDTTAVLKQIIAGAKQAIASGKKNGQGVVAAYGVIQSAQQQLDANLAAIPIKLQLELAKEQASGSDQTATLKKVKAALERALRKAKGNYEAQIAILNEISGINSQLGSSAASALSGFKQLNINKIAKGLHLTVEQAKELRSQLSQIGPGGTVPGMGVGAYGYAIAGGGTVHHHHHLYIDGKEVESSTRKHGHKRKARNSSQRRGPNAGVAD